MSMTTRLNLETTKPHRFPCSRSVSLSLAAALAAPVCFGLVDVPAVADTIELTGTIRDFNSGKNSGGHPDFETAGDMGRFGLIHGLVKPLLENGKPAYNPVRPNKDTIDSAASLAQWYTDVPGVNLNRPLALTFDNDSDTPGGVYTFNDSKFFPIDDELFGNEGKKHNYHFTFELKTTFTYVPGQRFHFTGDDDVWVFVNDQQVIDIGGVHSAKSAKFLLFDGKAFVEKKHFDASADGPVFDVTSSQAAEFAERWDNLGLDGDSPIDEGDYYVDLNLLDGTVDLLADWGDGATPYSVSVSAGEPLARVTLRFEDGFTQRFDNLDVGPSATFEGTGVHAGKAISAVFVRTASDVGPYFRKITEAGGGQVNATLDFFFAERHTSQSNFRIDTSIQLRDADTAANLQYD